MAGTFGCDCISLSSTMKGVNIPLIVGCLAFGVLSLTAAPAGEGAPIALVSAAVLVNPGSLPLFAPSNNLNRPGYFRPSAVSWRPTSSPAPMTTTKRAILPNLTSLAVPSSVFKPASPLKPVIPSRPTLTTPSTSFGPLVSAKPATFAASPSDSDPKSNHIVTIIEKYSIVHPNGTSEYKIHLSDGQIKFQRISNKVVNGKTIQVYEGYYTVRLGNDPRYRTTYYRADENGYKLIAYTMDTALPVWPYPGKESRSTRN